MNSFNKIPYKAVIVLFSKIIIKRLSRDQLNIFRKVEKITKSFIKVNADLKYLNFCANNQLLPRFTNFRPYDVSAVNDKNTVKFKTELLNREIRNKQSTLAQHSRESIRYVLSMKKCMSPLRFYSSLHFLKSLIDKFQADVTAKHLNKLRSLYGGEIFLPDNNDKITNLSSYTLSRDERSLLNRGLNFGLKQKPNPLNINYRIKLYERFRCLSTCYLRLARKCYRYFFMLHIYIYIYKLQIKD